MLEVIAANAPATPYVVLTVAPVLAVVLIAALDRWSLHRARLQTAPQHLLGELCRRHGFNAATQRLLRRVAAAAHLAQPAELFVFPARFDAAVAAARLRRRQRDELSRLRRQLFGEQATAPPEETTSSSSCPSLRSLPS